MFTVTNGIAIPADCCAPGQTKYPFGAMAVGDSFSVPEESARTIASSASYYGKHNGKKFAVRIIPSTGERRCWRIA